MGVPSIPSPISITRPETTSAPATAKSAFALPLESFSPGSSDVQIRVADQEQGSRESAFDYLVLALPFNNVASVLPVNHPTPAPLREKLSHFESCPITGIHLWFDRQITISTHAVLLNRTIQWMFHKSRLLTTATPPLWRKI